MTDLEPLDLDVRALLQEAKQTPDLEPGVRAAILSAVENRLAFPPGTPGGGGGAGGHAGPWFATGRRVFAVVAGTFALGVATGVALVPSVRAPPSSVSPPMNAFQEPLTVPAAPAPSETAEARVVPGPAEPATMRTEVPHALSARGLAAERALLDVARTELVRGDANAAWGAVERHAQHYADGVLVEEREALAVKTLVALGRRDEARARATRFAARFPNGLMLRAVKGALGEL